MNLRALLVLTTALAGSASPALAGGIVVLVSDRSADGVWILNDANADGIIQFNATEVTFFFGPGALGVPTGAANPNAIAYRRSDGLVLIGDQDTATGRKVFWAKDGAGPSAPDGDALDAGESGVYAAQTTGAGNSFAFPTGITFDRDGVPYICNSGNGIGPDAIWRCPDANDDHAADSITAFTTLNGFTTSNGPLVPYTLIFDHTGVGYLHNTGATMPVNLNAIYRLHDDDHSGSVDTAAEFAVWFNSANASGLPLSSGFGLCVDPVRPRSLYFQSTTTVPATGTDQIYRVTDFNNNGNAQDADEAQLVYIDPVAGFTGIDICALGDGSILFSDNTGKRIIHLTDLTGDGDFLDAGERADFLPAGSALAEVRNVVLIRDKGCSLADVGKQGGLRGGDNLLDNNDFVVFIDTYFNQGPNADIGKQGGVAGYDGFFDNNDFIVFIDQFFAGCLW